MMVKLSDKAYNILKWLQISVLPALATFVVAMGNVWGLTCATKIGATITALATFIGALIAVSSANYNKTVEETSKGGN